MKSKHLVQEDGYAHAIDLMAYDGSNPSWDIVDYDNIADAMRKAGKELRCRAYLGAYTTFYSITRLSRRFMNEYVIYEGQKVEDHLLMGLTSPTCIMKRRTGLSKRSLSDTVG